MYDIDPLVLAILEVYLDSHRKFSPASPGQVKWRLSGNKQWFTFWMQKWYSFHLPLSQKAKDCFASWQLKLPSGLLFTTERMQSQKQELYGSEQLKIYFYFTQGDREDNGKTLLEKRTRETSILKQKNTENSKSLCNAKWKTLVSKNPSQLPGCSYEVRFQHNSLQSLSVILYLVAKEAGISSNAKRTNHKETLTQPLSLYKLKKKSFLSLLLLSNIYPYFACVLACWCCESQR